MYIIKKPPINLDSPRTQDSQGNRYRSGTPTNSTASELQRLKKSVNEARATLSGHNTPVKQTNEYLESKESQIFQENQSLRTKIKKLQTMINESQDVQKLELYEKMIKAEIQKRVEIEKQFAREADQIQVKVSILEEQMKLRAISDEIIEKFLNSFRGYERIGKDGKKVIRRGHGEKVYELILFYERIMKKMWGDLQIFSDFIDKLLKILFGSELKEKLSLIDNTLSDIAEKRKAKFDLIEEGLNLRLEGERIIDNFLKEKMYEALNKDKKGPEGLDKGKKQRLKEAFGDKVVNLIDFYEQKMAGLKNFVKEKPDQIDSLLDLVLQPDDKVRTMNFIKDGDLESAACVLRNLNYHPHNERSESASKISSNTVRSPKNRRSNKSIPYRSLTPNRSAIDTHTPDKQPEISEKDFIVFLQCQANGLEDLLFNS